MYSCGTFILFSTPRPIETPEALFPAEVWFNILNFYLEDHYQGLLDWMHDVFKDDPVGLSGDADKFGSIIRLSHSIPYFIPILLSLTHKYMKKAEDDYGAYVERDPSSRDLPRHSISYPNASNYLSRTLRRIYDARSGWQRFRQARPRVDTCKAIVAAITRQFDRGEISAQERDAMLRVQREISERNFGGGSETPVKASALTEEHEDNRVVSTEEEETLTMTEDQLMTGKYKRKRSLFDQDGEEQ